jgi:hypothetical protein
MSLDKNVMCPVFGCCLLPVPHDFCCAYLTATAYAGLALLQRDENELLTLKELASVMGSEKEAKQLLSEIDLDK